TERMRALELGRTLPQDEPWWTPPRIGLSIGAGVPIGVFVSTAISSMFIGFHEGMWIAAAIVGTSGAIGGSMIAAQSLDPKKSGPKAASVKPYVEEDAYDVVAARG